MSQYQSFPDAAGHSLTVDKLKALRLPDLAGRRFLDVGCNEGFFCGFASFQGAAESFGIDHSREFIARAQTRFPHCRFERRSWEQLPDGKFDVILLASALHYADDQPALVRRLVDALSDDGLLVLEIGIASSPHPEWVNVQRGIDERRFPTMSMLHQVLAPYVWKWMGPSVRQGGDPVSRHVIHVSRRRPVAYLLMEPPGYGKSSLAGQLFGGSGTRVVSGDEQLNRAARGDAGVSGALATALSEGYSPFEIDQMTRRLFERGLVSEVVDLWLLADSEGTQADIAIDAYVPPEYHSDVVDELASRGYMPVQLHWNRPGPPPLPEALAVESAERFYMSLLNPNGRGGGDVFRTEPAGFIDSVTLRAGRIHVRGWAIDAEGRLPGTFLVKAQGRVHKVSDAKVEMRLDVQQHLELPHALVGFRFEIEGGRATSAWEIRNKLRVSIGDGTQLKLSGAVEMVFKQGSEGA